MSEVNQVPRESLVNRIFAAIDEKVGPSKAKYNPACQDVRDMLLECVLESDCMREPGAVFRQILMGGVNYYIKRACLQDGINKECKAIRYDYQLCRKSQVIWTKHFSKDDPR